MPKPERYQLPFEFGRRHDQAQPFYEISLAGNRDEIEGSGRFVRTVKEEVIVRAPSDAVQYLRNHVYTSALEAIDQEELWCLLFNTRSRITHEVMVYRGTVNTIYIRPAELFKEAVRVNAPALLLSHIHPSGSPDPSPEDIRTTQDAFQAGKLLGIEVLDHIIIAGEKWVSLKEKRLGFTNS